MTLCVSCDVSRDAKLCFRPCCCENCHRIVTLLQVPRRMYTIAVRSPNPLIHTFVRYLSSTVGKSKPAEELPTFQYVGKRSKRKDRVFVWGFSHTGALGIPSFVVPDTGRKKPKQYQLTPYRLDMDEKISSAACGYGFTLISSKTTDITKVWGMGLNKDSQLGFHRSRRDRTKGYGYVLEPSPVPLPLEKPKDTRVLQVSCGRAHSLILTDNEGVFSIGNNSYGQCARKVIEGEIYSESQLVHRVRPLESQIVQVACGQDHSLFRTERGEVYACGWGADGQTGLGHYNICSAPSKLAGDLAGVNVVQVATYGDCCLAVSEEGQVYGWGNSEYLQFATITDLTQVNVPRHLPFHHVGKVKQVACGGTSCALLNDAGELFVWGKNLRGCLGTGRLEDQYFPWRVTVPGEVVDVACGVDHMMALVKSFT
ncbi:RCC1-like G exchanging factor-like protein isoform X3 [Hyperolius riggenbachi]|uniref:RCC1-like G exchanging factor-like protein isoform X3 n=1 Tax=Hyperolius riggenbachi TaxID=752182 RepID=UPI0035A32796